MLRSHGELVGLQHIFGRERLRCRHRAGAGYGVSPVGWPNRLTEFSPFTRNADGQSRRNERVRGKCFTTPGRPTSCDDPVAPRRCRDGSSCAGPSYRRRDRMVHERVSSNRAGECERSYRLEGAGGGRFQWGWEARYPLAASGHRRSDLTAWFMSGSAAIGQASVSAPTDWRVPAVGDFNGDGKPDILWQHPVTGDLWVWFMSGSNWMGQARISGPTDWRVVAVGDFNADGKPDIIWQHPVTGELWVWFMNGSNWMGQACISGPTDWRVPAVGDLNGDGKPDIIWQHPVTGELWVWFMNGSNWMGQACISGPTDWRVPAVGDLNGDGKPDILWQYPPTGDLWVWFMNGSNWMGQAWMCGPML